ncbi:MAG: gliding motility lipoprotein GldB [Cyclobacteriaceae bacterium]|nr:gliding motility lipoprotein GldB [Cyclobacteriaceae bacterium]
MKKVLLALVGILLLSCSGDEKKCAFVPDTSALRPQLRFESLEDTLPAITTKADLVQFMTVHPDTRDLFFSRSAYPDDSLFINRLFDRFSNPHIDTLLMETHRVFGDGAALREEFTQAYANLKYYYPDFNPPRIQTLISGLETDLFLTDTSVFIGLDYFLGPGAKYRPNNMYEYMLRRYTKDFIVPSVMLLTGVDSRFNKNNEEDKTVLAEMIAYGKAYYFAKRMIPCVSDTLLMGYSSSELEGSLAYEHLIWSRLVQDQVLFSTSHLVKQRFLAERPKTIEVGENCPGRIAQWVGWRIVEKYMEEHPETTLPQLMAMTDAQRIFRESGYKPQVVKLPGREKS